MYSPTAQGRHQRNIPPPAPTPSENRFFMDWSSEGSRSPHEEPPVQNVPIGETLLSHRAGEHMKSNEDRQLHRLLGLLPSQPLHMKPIQMLQVRQF